MHINYYAWVCYRVPHWYIVACKKTNSICPFLDFPGNPSASLPNYFDNPFFRRSIVSFSFDLIISLYCRTYTVSVSITALKRYHGKSSSLICVAILWVAVGIVGAILFIYLILLTSYWVTICTWFDVTLVGIPGFIFQVSPYLSHLDPPLGFNRSSCMCLYPWSWCLIFLLHCGVFMYYLCTRLFWFIFYLTSSSTVPVCWLLFCYFKNEI